MIEQENHEKELILPGTLEFDQTLAQFPPNWRDIAWKSCGEFAHIVRPNTGGIIETVPIEVAEDYYFSGEYDDRLAESDFPSDEVQTQLFYDPATDSYYGFE